MKLIYLPRRGGKTFKAVAMCKKTGAYLVVLNHFLIKVINKQFNFPLNRMITHEQFIAGCDNLRGLMDLTLIIDDVDLLLQRLAKGISIKAITASRAFTKAECKKWGLPLSYIGRI